MSIKLAPYYFKLSNKTIILEHAHPYSSQKSINTTPNGLLSGYGHAGEYAQWKIILENNGQYCKLQSIKTNKYLRIGRKNNIDGTGGGGPFCQFKLHINQNAVKLESIRFPGSYIAVNQQRQVIVGNGGPWCKLIAYQFVSNIQKPQINIIPFSESYLFMQPSTVILKVPNGKTIFVSQNKVLYGGLTGKFAQWDTLLFGNNIVGFCSKANNKWLRITSNGIIDAQGAKGGLWTKFTVHKLGNGKIKLQSVAFQKSYIAVQNGNVLVGYGGQYCIFECNRNTVINNNNNNININKIEVEMKQDNININKQKNIIIQPIIQQNNIIINYVGTNLFGLKYLFKLQNTIIIKSLITGKMLRVNIQNNGYCNGLGGDGSFAQWKCYPLGNNKCKFQSVKTGKYLRIMNNNIDCLGAGGKYTEFIVIFKNQSVIKLESAMHKNKFIAVDKSGVCKIGFGGNLCEFTVWRSGGNNNNNNNNQIIITKPQIQMITCPKCNGLGFWGTFGACNQTSIHKQRACPACNGAARIANNRLKCVPCQGKGFMGAFGPCEYNDIHKRSACISCNGTCYVVVMQQQQQQQIIIPQQPQIIIKTNIGSNILVKCPKCNGLGYWGTFGACNQTSIHKKIACPACNGVAKIAQNRTKCVSCNGMGFMGTFGPCDYQSIHKKGVCNACRGKCYVV